MRRLNPGTQTVLNGSAGRHAPGCRIYGVSSTVPPRVHTPGCLGNHCQEARRLDAAWDPVPAATWKARRFSSMATGVNRLWHSQPITVPRTPSVEMDSRPPTDAARSRIVCIPIPRRLGGLAPIPRPSSLTAMCTFVRSTKAPVRQRAAARSCLSVVQLPVSPGRADW